jgi:hypothetical protein
MGKAMKHFITAIAAVVIASCAENEKRGEAYPPDTQKGEIESEKRLSERDSSWNDSLHTTSFPEEKK